MPEQLLYSLGIEYLKERVPEEGIIEYYLNLYQDNQLHSLEDALRQLLEHAKNRQGMPYSIGNLDPLEALLFGFNPNQVKRNFGAWEDIFYAIQGNYTPPGLMDIANPRNYWVIFSKSIFSAAKFLSRFETLQHFKTYCNSFIDTNPDTRIAFALLLSEEIDGFGFALACDFLKEWVSPHFVKPDTHLKDIFTGAGFAQKGESDFEICRQIIEYSNYINKIPYSVDKLYWLIGSGRLHRTAARDVEVRFATSKIEFINRYWTVRNGVHL